MKTEKNEIQSKHGLTVVHFSSKYNGLSHLAKSHFKEVESFYREFVNFYNYDINDSKDFATSCGISNAPAIVIFKNGVLLETLKGFVTSNKISSKILSHFKIYNRQFDYNLF